MARCCYAQKRKKKADSRKEIRTNRGYKLEHEVITLKLLLLFFNCIEYVAIHDYTSDLVAVVSLLLTLLLSTPLRFLTKMSDLNPFRQLKYV